MRCWKNDRGWKVVLLVQAGHKAMVTVSEMRADGIYIHYTHRYDYFELERAEDHAKSFAALGMMEEVASVVVA